MRLPLGDSLHEYFIEMLMRLSNISYSILLLLLVAAAPLAAQVQSPAEFLGYERGERFTPHYRIVDYYEHVAANSPLVTLKEYGKTYQGRPLIVATITSAANHGNITAIQARHIARTGLSEGATGGSGDGKAIVWFSYGVHGNEAGASNSSIYALWELINHPQRDRWLANTVILMDPCLNPDGFMRYTNWYLNHGNRIPNADPSDVSHNEPEPGGRLNHYRFDLNRDWAWQTQVETQQRLVEYHKWMPMVHVDFHEMFHNDPYYFAPAAAPFHEYITAFQREFQTMVGQNNASYFDQEGWLYFTKEVFDLFYPSYGDTYPTFNGAVGMTFEQGGHRRAGLAIATTSGDTLTLSDRITHHVTTSLATIETAATNADQLIENFDTYFERSRTRPKGKYLSYVFPVTGQAQRLQDLTRLLDAHRIQYGYDEAGRSTSGYEYRTGKQGRMRDEGATLVIPATQPMATLVQVLFDPDAVLEDSLTYDITAWALPYAYGLRGYASTDRRSLDGLSRTLPNSNQTRTTTARLGDQTYAIALPWGSVASAKVLGELHEQGLKVRRATASFRQGDRMYGAGTVLFLRNDNRRMRGWADKVRRMAAKYDVPVEVINTGFATSGPDLGSDRIAFTQAPKVAILTGDDVYANSFGEVWHHFEQGLGMQATIIDTRQLSNIDLDDYNVLVMPVGSYSSVRSGTFDKIGQWVNGGGKLIALGSAVSQLAGKSGFGVETKASPVAKERDPLRAYATRLRAGISRRLPGAVVPLRMDATHPLAYGIGDYFTLKTTTTAYEYGDNLWNVGVIEKGYDAKGFIGSDIRSKFEESMVLGVQDKGAGKVVYLADNPLFRGFWYSGKLVFNNALFMVW